MIQQPFVEPQRRPSRVRSRRLSLHRAGRRRSAPTIPAHRAQNASTLLGKMLRIDVPCPTVIRRLRRAARQPVPRRRAGRMRGRRSGRSAGATPGATASIRSALGGTGALVIADVGQNHWEEVDYEPRGAGGRNYGWRNREGAQRTRTPGARPPACISAADRSDSPVQPLGRVVDQRRLRLPRRLAGRRLPRAILLRRLRPPARLVDRLEHRAEAAKRRRRVSSNTPRSSEAARSSAASALSASISPGSSTSSVTPAASCSGCSAS